MSAGFDLYHKLLGIPSEEQAPNYYRLLGLTRTFEDDVEMIENCANRVMQSLKQYQLGARGSEIGKLLNEVTAARLTLLNPAKKLAYDERLRRSEHADKVVFRARRNDVFLSASPQEQYQARRFLIRAAIVIVVLAFVCIGYFLLPGLSAVSDRAVAKNDPVAIAPDVKQAKPARNAVALLNEQTDEAGGQSLVAKPATVNASEAQLRQPGAKLFAAPSEQVRENQTPLVDAERDNTSGEVQNAETSEAVAVPESTIGPFPQRGW
jgi:hypothetical protein